MKIKVTIGRKHAVDTDDIQGIVENENSITVHWKVNPGGAHVYTEIQKQTLADWYEQYGGGTPPSPSQDIHATFTITSDVYAESSGLIMFTVNDGTITCWGGVMLPNRSPDHNTYEFTEGCSFTYSNLLCELDDPDINKDNLVIDSFYMITIDNDGASSLNAITCSISGEEGKLIDGGEYTIHITDYTPPQ